jgi:hypothetical protein
MLSFALPQTSLHRSSRETTADASHAHKEHPLHKAFLLLCEDTSLESEEDERPFTPEANLSSKPYLNKTDKDYILQDTSSKTNIFAVKNSRLYRTYCSLKLPF